MKNYKQITVKNSIVEMLDRIREQLPARGSLKASYGDAIKYLDVRREVTTDHIMELESEIRILNQKKVRK